MRSWQLLCGGLALGLNLAACTDQSSSCGGPTSDFPFCGDEAPGEDGSNAGNTGGGATAGGATAGGGTGSPASDGADAGAAGAEPDACTPEPLECEGKSEATSVDGSSPTGAVSIDTLSLIYERGLTSATQLHLRGTSGGAPIDLTVTLPTQEPAVDGEVALTQPGTYTSSAGDAGADTSAWIHSCGSREALGVTVVIEAHTQVSVEMAGAGVLRGALTVDEAGWALSVPFVIDQACAQVVSP